MVFIRSVSQAVLTFSMSCFLFTASLCIELENIISRYWWKRVGGRRGISWGAWSKLCMHKSIGGLGFRDLAKFNVNS